MLKVPATSWKQEVKFSYGITVLITITFVLLKEKKVLSKELSR